MKCFYLLAILTIGFAVSGCDKDDDDTSGTEMNGNSEDDEEGVNWVKCQLCKGSGICYYCDGAGTVTKSGSGFSGDYQIDCPKCDATGYCSHCDGTGKIYY